MRYNNKSEYKQYKGEYINSKYFLVLMIII